MSGFFKSFVAASMALMAAGYGFAGEGKFAKGGEKVEIVKSSSGFWMVKAVA